MILSHGYTLKSLEGFKEHGCSGPIKSESLGWDPEVRIFLNVSIESCYFANHTLFKI